MSDKSVGLPVDVALADRPSGEKVIWKVMDPGSLLVRIYTAALMKAILGAWSLGIGGGSESGGVHRDSAGRFGGVIDSGNGVASPEDIVGAGPL